VYLRGELRLQAYAPKQSAELRLVGFGAPATETRYDTRRIESAMALYT
jgi:hypothetical protein